MCVTKFVLQTIAILHVSASGEPVGADGER